MIALGPVGERSPDHSRERVSSIARNPIHDGRSRSSGSVNSTQAALRRLRNI